jgi:hypothetical protein
MTAFPIPFPISPYTRFSWRRFSLRSLLAFVAVIAILMAWVAMELKIVRERQAIVDKVNRLGCFAAFSGNRLVIDLDYQTPNPALFAITLALEETRDFCKLWLYYGSGPRDVRPEDGIALDLTPLSKLGNIQYFEYRDPGLANLSSMAQIKSLERLTIANSNVRDLTPIVTLKNLHMLVAPDTPIHDLTPLASLQGLKMLVISRTQVDSFAPLAELTNLEILDADETYVNDLTPVANLKNLKRLSISNTPVRDLTALFGLKSLTNLDVSHIQVTKEQVAALQAALPNCKITSDWSAP